VNLLKNSLGVITCFSEFAETGVLKAICDAMPFDCIGNTSCLTSGDKEVGQIILAITVLTSDDCEFKTIGFPVTDDYKGSVAVGMAELLKKSEDAPKLILSYFPLIKTISGDIIIEEIDKATGGIPLFGTVAIDHNVDYSTSQTIYNGEAFRERVVLGAIYGNPQFTFEVASLNEEKVRKQKAIITSSEGSILTGVNGISVIDYLKEIGLTRTEIEMGLAILPLVVDHKDGTKPVARAIYAITPEGHAVCGGLTPVGATVAIGRIDMDDVLYTTEQSLKALVEEGKFIFNYSCMARYLALGANINAEAERVMEVAGDTPYMYSCSAGEICPLIDEKGNYRNFFHNYSIVFCKLW
jgi:hypothetical protein